MIPLALGLAAALIASVAAYLAAAYPEIGARPPAGVLRCWLRGRHSDVRRSETNFGGFVCWVCKRKGVDLEEFDLPGYVERRGGVQ